MEAKKSRKAAIENQRSSWLLMGVVVALAFMFVSFEWTRQDVKLAAYSSAHDPIFEEVLIPITHPEEKLEPPPPPDTKVTDVFNIVANDEEVETAMTISSEDEGKPYEVLWIPPVVETKEVEEDVIVVHAEVMPEFPGGTSALMKYLSTHIKYPAVSQEIGAYGRVIVQFIVDKDGTITEPVVVRGVEVHLDKEAIRVISSMPKWKPGMQNGKRVRVKYTLPVLFRLQ